MSTRARVRMKDYNGESYCYSLFCDGYPSSVVSQLPDGASPKGANNAL